MKHNNHHPGITALLFIVLFFDSQTIVAKYNQDIRHSLYTLPVIDHYGIVAELSVDEINRYNRKTPGGFVAPEFWYETIIRVPHWVKHARYCESCSEIPVFASLKAQGSTLKTKILSSPRTPEDKITLEVSSDYSYKAFSTSRLSLPELPDELNQNKRVITALLLGANPIMLREFDTDSYLRWSWVDNTFGSWFENHPMKVMPGTTARILKINPGNHYRIAVIMDEENNPEAILIDDAQGAHLRKLYTYLSPFFYGANAFELAHHAKQAAVFGAVTLGSKGFSMLSRLGHSLFLFHNLFEFVEHAGHLQVVQKGWKYFSDSSRATESESTEDEFEPDYILGSMDAVNLVTTTGELLVQLPLGPLTLLENTLSVSIGMANLLVSANQKILIEGFHDRIDTMIERYFTHLKPLYLENRSRL